MTREAITKHGHDHRAPKTNGPNDPGGHDPIPGIGSGGAFKTWRDQVLAQPSVYAFWPMDDASGSARDVVGGVGALARHAKTISAVSYPLYGVTGPFTALPAQTAIRFAGTSGVVAADDDSLRGGLTAGQFAALFSGTHAWTIECWLFATTTLGGPLPGETLVELWDGTLNKAIQLNIDRTTRRVTVIRGAESVGGGAPDAVTPSAQTFVRVTYDGTTLRLYIGTSGTPTSTAASSSSLTTTPNLTVGNNLNLGGTGYTPLNGSMADLAFYTTNLDALSTFPVLSPDGGTNAAQWTVDTADGAGGRSFLMPTIAFYKDGV